MAKVKKIDPYLSKYLKLLKDAKTLNEKSYILDEIYRDGFEDGVNSKEG